MSRVLTLFVFAFCLATFGNAFPSAYAQKTATEAPAQPERAAPYDDKLLRLAEILGSVQYLRNLCDPKGETRWLKTMQALLESETANEPNRRRKMIAGYNRGFRAFASVYTTCTDAARLADQRYRNEGATLVTEIVARYGN